MPCGYLWTFKATEFTSSSRPYCAVRSTLKNCAPSRRQWKISSAMEREATQRTAHSFYTVLLSHLRQPLQTLAGMGRGGKPFSIRNWILGLDPRQALILRQSQRLPELSAAMVRVALKISADAAADRMARSRQKTPIWFFLDEVAQIGNATAVPRLAAIGREGQIRLVILVQSLAQLRAAFGVDGCAHLLDNLTTKILGRMPPGEGQNRVVQLAGERKVAYWEPKSGGTGQTERLTTTIPVVEPGFVGTELGLKNTGASGRAVVRALLVGQGEDVALLEWPVGTTQPIRPGFVAREV
ncbi:Type IV secretion-system coupling protein DNA-binding domain-containing protein [Pelagibacterium luteolum]|uniref:Type IV secretion-system coupling protein DNA-binding domain-containing protein n=2 Tax=Pelagibacterium luteolum TaxID=440168 RepID=A0A1G7Y2H2_9HYPH|nr:Type IV secretion-system coupling protein DNA-binding domain-containing protein [Pelagibacterium luteolum]